MIHTHECLHIYIYICTVQICLNIFSFVLETRSRFFILFIMYFVSLLPSSRHPAPGTESPAVFAAPLARTMEIAGAEDLVSATWTSGGEQGTWLRDIRLDGG